ncbi:hypothetical protein ABT282_07160 [Streptomyces sp. NPDC000927]|uniref:hypothetical protein n=1 Tax=Streptomyces sp. NPDC000927 TaxID=3154371 RepID=UPI0033224A94
MNDAQLQKTVDGYTEKAEKHLKEVREKVIGKFTDGSFVSSFELEALLSGEVHALLWRSLKKRQGNGGSLRDALTLLKAKVEERIWDGGVMGSTSPLDNAMGIVQLRAQKRWVETVRGLIA